MIHILLLCAMLFQSGPQTASKPVIENDRVAVWDVTGAGLRNRSMPLLCLCQGARCSCPRARRRTSQEDRS